MNSLCRAFKTSSYFSLLYPAHLPGHTLQKPGNREGDPCVYKCVYSTWWVTQQTNGYIVTHVRYTVTIYRHVLIEIKHCVVQEQGFVHVCTM